MINVPAGALTSATLAHWRLNRLPFTGDVLSAYAPVGNHRAVLSALVDWLRRPDRAQAAVLCGLAGVGKTLTLELLRHLLQLDDHDGTPLGLVDNATETMLVARATTGPPTIYAVRIGGSRIPTSLTSARLSRSIRVLLLEPWTRPAVRQAIRWAWVRAGGGALVPFSERALEAIAALSGGVPRRVVWFVQGALVLAAAERARSVSSTHVERLWQDRQRAWWQIGRLARAA